jgi:hypothetical protein
VASLRRTMLGEGGGGGEGGVGCADKVGVGRGGAEKSCVADAIASQKYIDLNALTLPPHYIHAAPPSALTDPSPSPPHTLSTVLVHTALTTT